WRPATRGDRQPELSRRDAPGAGSARLAPDRPTSGAPWRRESCSRCLVPGRDGSRSPAARDRRAARRARLELRAAHPLPAPHGPREVVFDTALAARTGTRVGDRVELVVRGRAERFRVVGLASAPSGASSSVFFFDRATPTLLAKRGAVDSIGIFATRGVSIGRLQRRIEKALPARTTRTLRGD